MTFRQRSVLSGKFERIVAACVFMLLVANVHASFRSQSVDTRWPVRQFLSPPPNVFVLAIGIDNYSDSKVFKNLSGAESDAHAVAKTFEQNLPGSSVNVSLLTNRDATKANIRAALQHWALKSTSADLFILSFSGHTFTKKKDGAWESYLAPADAAAQVSCENQTCIDESTVISGALLNSWMNQIHAQRQVLLLDSSYTDKLLPAFEQHWRKESCSVGPVASKRMLIITNHGPGYEVSSLRQGLLTYDFVQQMSRLRDKGLVNSFGLQQAMYLLAETDSEAVQDASKSDQDQENRDREKSTANWMSESATDFRIEMLGGDFVITSTKARVKRTDLLLDSDLGPICGDSEIVSRGAKIASGDGDDDGAKPNSPTNYALVIATDHYKDWKTLKNPIFDGEAVETDLSKLYGFKTEHLWGPSRNQLREKLDQLHSRKYNDADQVFIFIAGHGDYDETNDIGYLVFAEASLGHNYDEDLSLQELRSRIDTIPAKHIFLVMDSCFAGSIDPLLGGSVRGEYDNIPLAKLRQRSEAKKTRYFLTSGGKEYVSDGIENHHSPFASLFITALEKDGKPDGYLNISQMPHYFERLATTPRFGNLGHNEDGSDFFFIPVDSADGQ